MKNLEILIENDKRSFKPTEKINGKIRWQFTSTVPVLHLKLYWQTSGRSKQDAEVVQVRKIDKPEQTGCTDFNFKFPYGPPSYKGKLFNLDWFLELYTDNATYSNEIIELELKADF